MSTPEHGPAPLVDERPATGATPHVPGRRSGWRRTLGPSPWWVLGPFLLYAVLVLGGVTQSSIGIPGLRADPAAPTGIQLGGASGIRSDEYLTSTPLLLGIAASGETDDLNPLTAPQGFSTQMPAGPVSSVVLLDGTMLRLGPFLPDQMLVAARWWLPFLLLALGMPAFVGRLTGNRWYGLAAAALVVVAPASAWWSFSPLGVLGFTIAGAAALQNVEGSLREGQRLRAVGWGALAALLLARTPLHYQPWAVVLAVPILAAAIVPMLADRTTRRTGLVAVAATGGASLALAGGVILENLESIRATLGTTYPGARVASGGANPVQEIFGATSLGRLKDLAVVGSNPSEISSAFAVCAVWAVLLLLVGVRFADLRNRAAALTMLGFTGFWFAWSMVDFGPWATRVPVLSMVPSNRAADVLGYLSVLLLVLVLPAVRRVSPRQAVVVGSVVALLAAYAGSLMRLQTVPDLPTLDIWASSAAVGVVVVAVTLRPRWWGGYVAAVAGGALLMWHVNPILVGLADLRGSEVAQHLLTEGAEAREAGEVWVADDLYVDALLTATGVPSLSSRQLAGPDRDGWEMLDPTGAAEDAWNRGGSHITFEWTVEESLTIDNPAPDVIHVAGSPCTLAERVPGLTTVVGAHQLWGIPCLEPAGTFLWGGTTRYVYTIGDGAAD